GTMRRIGGGARKACSTSSTATWASVTTWSAARTASRGATGIPKPTSRRCAPHDEDTLTRCPGGPPPAAAALLLDGLAPIGTRSLLRSGLPAAPGGRLPRRLRAAAARGLRDGAGRRRRHPSVRGGRPA